MRKKHPLSQPKTHRRRINSSKDSYLLANFSKIKHKKWELYAITRILHLLDDEDLEYVCQQLVKTSKSDEYFLTDLCFPSLGLYIEINEGQHFTEKAIAKDKHRQREIFDATKWQQLNIDVYDLERKKHRSLDAVKKDIDSIIEKIKECKHDLESGGNKITWDYGAKYDPQTYLKKGSISVEENIGFLYTRDALQLFGYKKGNYQQGIWHIKGTNETVWFPKLYDNRSSDGVEWINTLENNFQTIKMRKKVNGNFTECPNLLERAIVFAHYKNLLGHVVYKFMGVFEPSLECAKGKTFRKGKTDAKSMLNIYHRRDSKLDLSRYNNN